MTASPAPHVVVVGAGPAGSAAAAFLARRGARVRLLERHRFPRDKSCGDGLTPRCLAMLRRLGCSLPVRATQPIQRAYLVSPSGFVHDTPFPNRPFGSEGGVIERRVLDEALARHAVGCGADLREGEAVTELGRSGRHIEVRCRSGERLRADVVLGCDGAPSLVRTLLGAPRYPAAHTIVALRAYFEGVTLVRPDAFAVFYERDLLPGYGWIFPLPGERANVGIGMRADHIRRRRVRLGEMFERFCRSPAVAAQLAQARRVGRPVGHLLPLGSFQHRVSFDQALLLGDAAGFINPATGEGIEYALESGEVAARAIDRAERKGDFGRAALSVYDRECAARFSSAFELCHLAQLFFSTAGRVEASLRGAARSAWYNDLIFDVFGGNIHRPWLRAIGTTLRRLRSRWSEPTPAGRG